MMKKLLLIAVLAVFSFTTAHSQTGLRLGVNVGMPMGDADDITTFKAGADLAYMVSLMDIVEVGPMVGYTHFFGEDGFDDHQYLPIAASGRLGFPQTFFGGLDLGYAVGIGDSDGGLYWRPLVGFQLMNFALHVSYEGISGDLIDVSSLNLGVEISL